MFRNRWDIQNVLVLQLHVRYSTCHDSLQVNRKHLLGTIRLQAAQYSTIGHRLRSQSISSFHQTLNTVDLVAQLVHTRT